MNDILINKAHPPKALPSDKLSINANEDIKPREKVKVLLGCLSFANLTGS